MNNILLTTCFIFQVKIPSKLNDKDMETFLYTLCKTCEACPYLITLEPEPDQCNACLKAEQEEAKIDAANNDSRCKGVKRSDHVVGHTDKNTKRFKLEDSNDKCMYCHYGCNEEITFLPFV